MRAKRAKRIAVHAWEARRDQQRRVDEKGGDSREACDGLTFAEFDRQGGPNELGQEVPAGRPAPLASASPPGLMPPGHLMLVNPIKRVGSGGRGGLWRLVTHLIFLIYLSRSE